MHIMCMDVMDIDIIMKVFIKNPHRGIYQIYINRGRTITTQGAHEGFVGILSFLLFLSW